MDGCRCIPGPDPWVMSAPANMPYHCSRNPESADDKDWPFLKPDESVRYMYCLDEDNKKHYLGDNWQVQVDGGKQTCRCVYEWMLGGNVPVERQSNYATWCVPEGTFL